MSMQTAGSATAESARSDSPGPQLRRLSRELILLVLAKIVLLTLIWWVAMSHYARPDTRPAAIEHVLAPASASSTPQAGHP